VHVVKKSTQRVRNRGSVWSRSTRYGLPVQTGSEAQPGLQSKGTERRFLRCK